MEWTSFLSVNNIKSVQLHPVPEKLPEFVIQGASVVDVYLEVG